MAESVYAGRSLDLLFRILTRCGVFMPQSLAGTWKSVLYRTYSCFIVTGTVLMYLLSQIMDIIMNLGDWDQNIQTSLLAISLITASIKTINSIFMRQSLQKIRDMLDGPKFTTVSAEGSKHLLKSISTVQLFVKMFMFVSFGTTTLWSVFPIFDKSDENVLPSKAWFPWDKSEKKTYLMLYSYQVIAITIIAAFNASQDLLMSSAMLLAGGQLDVLRAELSTLGTDFEQAENESNECANPAIEGEVELGRAAHVNDRLHACISRHREVIRYVKVVEYAFGLPIFSQIMGGCIIICVTAFQMSQTKFSVEFMSHLFYIVTITFQLLLYCYPGNEITLKSELISTAAYECPWYDQDTVFRKKLRILMERSKRPIVLAAGRILPLTLQTFTSILRSSYSYYAVLQRMHSGESLFANEE